MIPLVEVLTRTETYLRERGIGSPRLEAELLLGHVLKLERLRLYLAHDRPLTEDELEELRRLVGRRGRREPLAWILGHKPFHALDLEVGPGVLVPRPDTETLVDLALEWIEEGEDPVYVADVGCGSGAIGLAIAAARPNVRLYAIDLEAEPLATTRHNVQRLGLGKRVAVLEGDLLAPVPAERPIDWVVSNPPYIPSADIGSLEPEVSRWEPRRALDGGPDGLDIYRKLVPAAARRARRGLLVEVGIHQAPRVVQLFTHCGFTAIETRRDLGGIVRVVGGRRPTS